MLAAGCAELAYGTWTALWARGQGVAPSATAIPTRWTLDEIGFHRLELLHAVRNEASCRVATKSGFALEGTKRRALLHPDVRRDMHLDARAERLTLRARSELFRSLTQLGRRSDPDRRGGARPDRATAQM